MSVAAKQEVMTAAPVQSTALTPMDMIDRAVTAGAAPEVIEKFMSLHERWEAGQARKAFDRAVAEAKADIKPVVRNRQGHNSKKYADFAAIANSVDPILASKGLAYRFRTTQTPERINVTCVLFGHGHSEESSLSGPADTTGNKNAIQAIGSTLTYLQRYSLVQMLGLAASDDDDGKAGAAGGSITEDQLIDLRELIEDKSADLPAFLKFFKITALADLPASRLAEATTMLNAKKAKA